MGLLDTLTRLVSTGNVTEQHFDQAAQDAPTDVLGSALVGAFRSSDTPSIGKMVGTLFGNSNGE
jgi:hypothetical protein